MLYTLCARIRFTTFRKSYMKVKNVSVKKSGKVADVLLSLSESFIELSRLGVGSKRLWYWEYYQSMKDDIKDVKLRRQIYQQIYHLERFGYLDKKGLTKKASDMILGIVSGKKQVTRTKEWDGKWRIVIFDVPEKRKSVRNVFRSCIKRLGFQLLQYSIWVSPFGDFDEIQHLAKEYKMEKCVVLIIADKISNELLYRKKFGLL